jgi:hypothetical protein
MDDTEIKDKYDFLNCEQGKELFATLDFTLKDGVHIQNYGKQKELFHYLQRYFTTLSQYYHDFWNLELEKGGNDSETYYYLKFYSDSRWKIPQTHRYSLAKDHLIVGFLLYKVYYIDRHIELNSLNKFQRLIRIDYPDLKSGIVKTLAKARKEKATQMNDDKIDNCIKNAFDEFNKIKWIEMDNDGTFDILPAFQRITREFAEYINSIEDILINAQNEEISTHT